ncbi:MAG: (Fe-S)-binding protein [Acidobacteriota bacterium]|nr:(Fe-S)-binding protein [Acidobacteriota bacterium]
MGTMFASGKDGSKGAGHALLRLADRAGVRLEVPDEIGSLCCGTPWKSKGMLSGEHHMDERLFRVLGAATRNWQLPIICDNVSCTEGIEIALRHQGVENATVLDATTFAAQRIAPLLPELPREKLAVVHPTCSSTRMGTNDALIMLAGLVADQVIVPDGWRCCAFAGDRGLLHEELTATAGHPSR